MEYNYTMNELCILYTAVCFVCEENSCRHDLLFYLLLAASQIFMCSLLGMILNCVKLLVY